jgi:FkbM family methyltransferase
MSGAVMSVPSSRFDENARLWDDTLSTLAGASTQLRRLADRIGQLCDAAGSPEGDRYSGHPDQAFGHVTYAQFGEDLILLNIFELAGIARPTYIDIGAHHPLHVSNTALLYMRGARGINVEANPALLEPFAVHRPEDVTLGLGVGAVHGTLDFYMIDEWSGRNTFDRTAAEAFVREHPAFSIRQVIPIPVVPLDELVIAHAGGRYPELLCIDAEGLDYDILAAAHFQPTRPLVVCVEAVSGADADDSRRLERLLDGRGYVLYTRTLGNLIFVHGSLAKELMPHGSPFSGLSR